MPKPARLWLLFLCLSSAVAADAEGRASAPAEADRGAAETETEDLEERSSSRDGRVVIDGEAGRD